MSKLRSLNTCFWSDPFIEDLKPDEKLVFIYLITNDKTNMLGIYESSIKKMSFETGVENKRLETILKAFEGLGKVKYNNNYVILKNYLKHQNFNTNMKKAAIDCYNNLPKELKDNNIVVSKDNPLEGFETLLNHYGMLSKVEYEEEEEIEDKKESNIDARKLAFKESLYGFLGEYKRETVKDFFEYWSEHGEKDKKMRFEKEKSFSASRRLARWAKLDYNKTEHPEEEKGKGSGGVSMEELYNANN